MDTIDDEHASPAADDPHAGSSPTAQWSQLWARIDAVPGWLTQAQARALSSAVQRLPAHGTVVEIGSHRGRSTLVLATARPDVRVVAIDPFIQTRLLPGSSVQRELLENVRQFGVDARVELIATTSRKARATWTEPIDLLWIDGKHDVISLLQDLRWTRFLAPGAAVFVHDSFSSLGVTLGITVNQLRRHRSLRFQSRVGSLAHFSHEPATAKSRTRVAGQLPWFARNLIIKVLLRLRLNVLARQIFGHTGRADPF